MLNLNIAVYAEGCMYPAPSPAQPVATTITQLQGSGFGTAIVSLFHIGRDYDITPLQIMGDIYFNTTLVISRGVYVGDPTWPGLMNGLIGGSVTKACASIGGGGVMDFETIEKIYVNNGESFDNTNLMTCFQCFAQTFPAITIIDMDCEETYDQPSFVAFCQMLIGMGFGITFCPYTSVGFWTGSLAALNTSNPGAVKRWNLQCYDGGSGNDPGGWAAQIQRAIPGFSTTGFIVAGDWTQDFPTQVQALMTTFAQEPSVGGGFMWTLDSMIANASMSAYASAISAGLGESASKAHPREIAAGATPAG